MARLDLPVAAVSLVVGGARKDFPLTGGARNGGDGAPVEDADEVGSPPRSQAVDEATAAMEGNDWDDEQQRGSGGGAQTAGPGTRKDLGGGGGGPGITTSSPSGDIPAGFAPVDRGGRVRGGRNPDVWHNSDGRSPKATAVELRQHLWGAHRYDAPLPGDRDTLDRMHAADHSQRGECGAHEAKDITSATGGGPGSPIPTGLAPIQRGLGRGAPVRGGRRRKPDDDDVDGERDGDGNLIVTAPERPGLRHRAGKAAIPHQRVTVKADEVQLARQVDARTAALLGAKNRKVEAWRTTMQNVAKQHFERQRRVIKAKLDSKKMRDALAVETKAADPDDAKAKAAKLVGKVFDKPTWRQQIADDATGVLHAQYDDFGNDEYARLANAASLGGFDTADPRVRQFIASQVARLGNIEDTTEDALTDAFADAYGGDTDTLTDDATGDDTDLGADVGDDAELADTAVEAGGADAGDSLMGRLLAAVDATFDNAVGPRAALIGLVETHAAANGATQAAGEQAYGDDATKTWTTMADDRVRDWHDDAEGQEVPIGEPFDVMGEALMYPGDPDGSPENTINCRCFVVVNPGQKARRFHIKTRHRYAAVKTDWSEAEHPRDAHGRFAGGGDSQQPLFHEGPAWDDAKRMVAEASKGTPYGTKDPAVHKASTTTDHPRYFFHTTKTTNRDSIREHGLQANRSLGGKNTRVYLAAEPFKMEARSDTKPSDLYRVDTQGVPLRPDPEVPDKWAISEHDFAPGRVELVDTSHPDGLPAPGADKSWTIGGTHQRKSDDQPRDPDGRFAGGWSPTKILSVTDTREHDFDTGKPIPGSGHPRECDRCGREHEVHVTVQGDDNAEHTVGSGCAKATGPLADRLKSAVSAATTQARLTSQRDRLTERVRAGSEVEAAVNAMTPPEPVEGTMTFGADETARQVPALVIPGGRADGGDIRVHTGFSDMTDPADRAERTAAVQGEWRNERMRERGVDRVRLRHDRDVLEDTHVRLAKVTAKLASLTDPDTKAYNPSQERDDHGRFGSGGGGSDAAAVQQAAVAWQRATDTSASLREAAERLLAGGKATSDTDRRAKTILNGVAKGERVTDSLHRGIAVRSTPDEIAAKYSPGNEVTVGLSSFSTRPEEGDRWAGWSAEGLADYADRTYNLPSGQTVAGPGDFSGVHTIHFEVEPGARTLPIHTGNAYLDKEDEHVTAGRFKVTGLTYNGEKSDDPDAPKVDGVNPNTRDWTVRLRQIEAPNEVKAYNPSQERDFHGRFGSGGGPAAPPPAQRTQADHQAATASLVHAAQQTQGGGHRQAGHDPEPHGPGRQTGRQATPAKVNLANLFAHSPHDKLGTRGYCDAKELQRIQRLAVEKIKAAPKPTQEDIDRNRRSVATSKRPGGEFRGSSKDRAARAVKLMKEFGDGTHAHCVYCGRQIDRHTVSQDKIYVERQGGRYKYANLLASCVGCNEHRNDTPIIGR